MGPIDAGGRLRAKGLAQRAAVAEAVAQIWRASTDQALWLDAMRAIRELLPRTIGGTLYTPFRQGQPGGLWINLDPPEGLIEAYVSRFADKDIFLHSVLRRLPRERFVFTEEIVPQHALESAEIYRDWMVPFGIRKAIGAAVHATGQEATIISMAGPGWSEREAAQYRAVMEELSPHIHGAIAAHWRLVRAETNARISRYALDELALGIAWLNAEGKVMHANRTAQAVFDGNDGLQLTAGRIAAAAPAAASRLAAGIARLGRESGTGIGAGNGASNGADRNGLDVVVAVSRPSRRQPYVVSLVPAIADPAGIASAEVRIIAFISDPTIISARLRGRLGELYGLTRSEAEIAESLARGDTPDEVAAHRGVSMNTVRTQLKTLMGKLGVTRQSDVIRAVMTLSTLGGAGDPGAP